MCCKRGYKQKMGEQVEKSTRMHAHAPTHPLPPPHTHTLSHITTSEKEVPFYFLLNAQGMHDIFPPRFCGRPFCGLLNAQGMHDIFPLRFCGRPFCGLLNAQGVTFCDLLNAQGMHDIFPLRFCGRPFCGLLNAQGMHDIFPPRFCGRPHTINARRCRVNCCRLFTIH